MTPDYFPKLSENPTEWTRKFLNYVGTKLLEHDHFYVEPSPDPRFDLIAKPLPDTDVYRKQHNFMPVRVVVCDGFSPSWENIVDAIQEINEPDDYIFVIYKIEADLNSNAFWGYKSKIKDDLRPYIGDEVDKLP